MSVVEAVLAPFVFGLSVQPVTHARVCNCKEGGFGFLTTGLLNDVVRKGFVDS